MARCPSCSAPLPPYTGVCAYCGTTSDIDLRAIHEFTVNKPESSRTCPACDVPLQTIDLRLEGRFYIERCRICFGLFFDNGELEALLDGSVANVFLADRERLDALGRGMAAAADDKAFYRNCPVCRNLMNRVNFGHRSGVIVDQCRSHGVWLDGGELRRLLEWKKAGGQLLHEEIRKEKEQENRRLERRRALGDLGSPGTLGEPPSFTSPGGETALLTALARLLGRVLE